MNYQTERLILRPWDDDDAPAFARLNADPQVMRYFPAPLSREQSDAMLCTLRERMTSNGFGMWAVEERRSGDFIGMVGLNRPVIAMPFGEVVEIGWRLVRAYQGRGYAYEAAHRALDIGFHDYGLTEIVAFTALANLDSQRLMARLGMARDIAFDHPSLPEGDWLRRHILYRLRR
ncbi:GNAT family N-acetyltransferase [Jejubacter calystegiae]|uniref:GNAT family N-acetyltransferase n=1 Tax=Jejubacter calystegiae TaxID=2579935 RepID=A0A4P8YMM2_9ENTR|nr:GNAT family N-acetyltransferase [Jejubacter calystegiae]QCT21433.1 GNAT family N-acetyltransferase [Jejubacter calystegiae]